ncbi:MAG: SUMF1/EgtB/PvdO family nonheme iron enzyme [Chitinophagaceae bacterium]|nr:SUMF1/EgtB/PvdO family nonheme iron enzyme [Chitinophagaceae bacterium]
MPSSRRDFVKKVSLLSTFPFVTKEALYDVHNFDAPYVDVLPRLIEAPEDAKQWPAFRERLHEWRKAKKKAIGYTGASYDDAAFQWAAKNYSCCFLMMYDLEFFDPASNTYTIKKVIDRGKQEFGGYDSVVLWHAYPRIGIDERNQFDFYRDMPGGLAGIRKVVNEFHAENIKVFVNYNPWDTSTKREGKSDVNALVELIGAIDADGIFLDTLKEVEAVYRDKLNGIKPGIVLEGEFAADIENIPANHLSWAQWFSDKYVPGVLRNKWFERRHMQHQIARWDRDHTTELHQAWMNGSGVMIWENVFGQWIGWNERDKSILRLMLPIQRRFHELFAGESWTPLVETLQEGVFASLWEGKGIKLWTLVNRHNFSITGDFINTNEKTCYNLISGDKLKNSTLSGTLSARSIGCFISAPESADLNNFLLNQKNLHNKYNNDSSFPTLVPRQSVIPGAARDLSSNHTVIPGAARDLSSNHTVIPSAARDLQRNNAMPNDMIELHPHTFNQKVELLVREVGDFKSAMDVNVSDQLNDPYLQLRMVHVPHMAIDKYPVTNQQYFEFLRATMYEPGEKHFFLRHWRNGNPPAEKENHPVVYVSLEDARAYAQWKGMRLPSEAEWQFAAQGYEQLRYPWGKELKKDCYNDTSSTTPVDAHPAGKSPFGVYDMCGNTWEFTESEYADEHNRFCILKGGSYYHAKDSMWYTSGGPVHSSLATKFLMMYPGLDRCSTIGFRCAVDL